MLTIVALLVSETVVFFSQVSPWEFFTATRWTPLFQEKHFGILPLLTASLQVTVGAGLFALPIGLFTAIFLSEFASPRVRGAFRGLLEVLASIPTVVYGYFALTFVTPALRAVFPGIGVFNAGSAAIVLGIMILPTVSSLSESALGSVPSQIRGAAYALGATKGEVVSRVVVPAGLPGVIASFLFALSRALGETMVVSIAAGASAAMTLNPLESVQTMTAYILQGALGEAASGSLEYRTLFAVGSLLFLLTLGMNWAGQRLRGRMAGGRRE
jgi:phosphate transport system permease protein